MSAHGPTGSGAQPERPTLPNRSISSGAPTMNTDHIPPPSLQVRTAATEQDTSRYSPGTSTSSSPSVRTPLRASYQKGSSPNRDQSPNPRAIRRSLSAMSLNGARTAPSPTLSKKGSRVSLNGHGDQSDKHLTPKRSISNLIAGLREAQSSMDIIEEIAPLTATQIASNHFEREIANHASSAIDTKAAVILHDACYGHRWSRLRTPKNALAMIVERPERILAGVLGASLAYVRLGGHHADGRRAPHPHIAMASTSPPFRIHRSVRALEVLESCVTNVHGTSWMSELDHLCGQAADRLSAGLLELTRSHTADNMGKPKLHEGDLYLSPESIDAFQGALGAVADAIDMVFDVTTQITRAFVAVRPPGHHCSSDHPSGFCWLNNVHVGIEYAAQNYGLTHAAILDFDLHHGDGSQAITWQRNGKNNTARMNAKPNSKLKLGPEIGYYSLHDINSYPCEMGDDDKVQAASLCIDGAHGQSIWNVHLQPWKNEAGFWKLYETQYAVLLDKARIFLKRHTERNRAEGKAQPRAALFISAGFDASEWEGSGMQRHKVNVPTEFYARFTQDTVRLANEIGTSCEGRVVSVLEGGYSDRAICSGVLSHLSGLCSDPPKNDVPANPTTLDDMMRGLQIEPSTASHKTGYDRTWWSEANLSALENVVNPAPPAQAKKVRSGQRPTYATPTESFAYKIIDPNKFARSVSGTLREKQSTRPPTPPPPAVDWIVATQELSNILTPKDRQTRSHTADELAVPKEKKEKAEIVNNLPPQPSAPGRQLRDRSKQKPSEQDSNLSDNKPSGAVKKSSQSSNRRQTMHELPSIKDEPPLPRTRRASQRFSPATDVSTDGQQVRSSPPLNARVVPSSATVGQMRPPSAQASSRLQVNKSRIATHNPGMNSTTSASAPVTPAKPARASSVSRLENETRIESQDDVDQLTLGLKKIVLKVGSREEHDRKQKEREAAERRARAMKGAETRRINAAAKKAAKPVVTSPVTQDVASSGSVTTAPELTKEDQVRINSPGDIVLPSIQAVGSAARADYTRDDINQHSMAHTEATLPLRALSGGSTTTDSNRIGNAVGSSPTSDTVAASTSFSAGLESRVPAVYEKPAAYEKTLPQWSSSGTVPFASHVAPQLPRPSGIPKFASMSMQQPANGTLGHELHQGTTSPSYMAPRDTSTQAIPTTNVDPAVAPAMLAERPSSATHDSAE